MWLLPTHNRPERCQAVLDAISEMGCTTRGVVLVNGGTLHAYQDVRPPQGWGIVFKSENLGLCGAMQWCFETFPDEPFYGQVTDDEYVRTPGWDKLLSEAAGRWYVAHGKNHAKSTELPHGFMTFGGDLVRAVGWWEPPELWHWYSEAFWDVIGKRLGLMRPCPEVLIEEKHYSTGKVEFDETNRLGEMHKDRDQELFIAWLRDRSEAGMLATCERVQRCMQEA